MSVEVPFMPRPSAIADYIDGVAFFVHLLGVPFIASKLSTLLCSIQPVVRWLASLTFAIYLFHLPLIRLAAGTSPFIEHPGSYQNIAFVYLTSLSVIVVIGVPAERSKQWYRRKILQYVSNSRLHKWRQPSTPKSLMKRSRQYVEHCNPKENRDSR